MLEKRMYLSTWFNQAHTAWAKNRPISQSLIIMLTKWRLMICRWLRGIQFRSSRPLWDYKCRHVHMLVHRGKDFWVTSPSPAQRVQRTLMVAANNATHDHHELPGSRLTRPTNKKLWPTGLPGSCKQPYMKIAASVILFLKRTSDVTWSDEGKVSSKIWRLPSHLPRFQQFESGTCRCFSSNSS